MKGARDGSVRETAIRQIVYFAILSFICLVVYRAVGSVRARLGTARVDHAQAAELYKQTQQAIGRMDVINKRHAALLAAWDKTSKSISGQDRVSYFLKQITRAASKTGVVLEAIRPDASGKTPEGFGYSGFAAQLEGYQSALINYLAYLERNTNFIKISNFSFRPKSDDPRKLTMQVSFQGFVSESDAFPAQVGGDSEIADPVAAAKEIVATSDLSAVSAQPDEKRLVLSERNVFIPPTYKPPIDTPPPPSYKLVGIVPDAVKPVAIIEDLKTQQTFMIGAGASVGDGFYTIDQIQPTQVILKDKKGKLSMLELYPQGQQTK